jgi:hypothetical protein
MEHRGLRLSTLTKDEQVMYEVIRQSGNKGTTHGVVEGPSALRHTHKHTHTHIPFEGYTWFHCLALDVRRYAIAAVCANGGVCCARHLDKRDPHAPKSATGARNQTAQGPRVAQGHQIRQERRGALSQTPWSPL